MFLYKNLHYIVVVLVPNFHLSARPFSFFLAFFLLAYGEPFYGTPYIVMLELGEQNRFSTLIMEIVFF